jgi:hypothetical protein
MNTSAAEQKVGSSHFSLPRSLLTLRDPFSHHNVLIPQVSFLIEENSPSPHYDADSRQRIRLQRRL